MTLASADFLTVHPTLPWLLLIGLALFPRITLAVLLFVGGIASGGILWWLGFIFVPHLLVAFLSLPYWHTNPVLVVFAWVFALCGTGGEGSLLRRRRR